MESIVEPEAGAAAATRNRLDLTCVGVGRCPSLATVETPEWGFFQIKGCTRGFERDLNVTEGNEQLDRDGHVVPSGVRPARTHRDPNASHSMAHGYNR